MKRFLLVYFQSNGDSYDNMLSLSREQFCEALALLLSKGTKEEVRTQW